MHTSKNLSTRLISTGCCRRSDGLWRDVLHHKFGLRAEKGSGSRHQAMASSSMLICQTSSIAQALIRLPETSPQPATDVFRAMPKQDEPGSCRTTGNVDLPPAG